MDTTIDLQDKGRKLVAREVYANASHLFYTLRNDLSADSGWYDDLLNLCEGAPSYGEYDLQCKSCGCAFIGENEAGIPEDELWLCPNCGKEFQMYQLDFKPTEYAEVFEHWIISEWLADRLAGKGEKVDKDFMGLCVWGRCATGQAIYMDPVFEDIVMDIIDLYGEDAGILQ